MSDNPQQELIDYRLQQADDSLLEAQTLAKVSLWRGAINRSYYAMFYATLALTVQKQQVISKHTGVIAFFDKEFIRTGVFPKEMSRSLHFAFERRQNSDYGELLAENPEEAMRAIDEAAEFVQKVKDYLRRT
jgi:uncharacterized protein (UPF0332 family)